MYFAALLVAVLLALHGLAADSASTSTIPCLIANTTLLVTKNLTVSCPKTTLYVSGNISVATGISMTSAHSSINLVTPGPCSNHTTFVPAYPMTRNATGTNAGGVMTTSALANTTLPKTNMTKISTTGSQSFLLSNTREVSSATKHPAPAEASPETVDVQTFPSQLGTSTTTLTKETTVTQLPTFTCTVGQPCSFRSYNGTTLTISLTTSCSSAGPTSGSSGPTLNSFLNSSEGGTMDTLLTSSTMTRTVTLKTSAGIFAAVTTLASGTFTPLTPSAVTFPAGSTASTTESLAHATTSNTTTKGPLVHSIVIASTSSASTSLFSSAIIGTSTNDMDIDFTAMGTSIMSIPPVPGASEGMFTSMGSMMMSIPLNSSGIIATPLRSSPGSGPTPSISGTPAASGEAGKGVVGGLAALVGGVVVGLL